MKCQIQWVDEKGHPTPDRNEAIGLCGTFHRSCAAGFEGQHGCKQYWQAPMGRCLHPLIEVRPVAIPICEEHAKQLRELPNWWFLDFRSNAL